MIYDRNAALAQRLTLPVFAWHEDAAHDERLRLGKRHRKWLALRWHVQEGLPVASDLQGARTPNEKTLIIMSRLGMIYEPDDTPIRWVDKRLEVTRDGQAAVTWWHGTWAPMTCAPTWGLPILCAIPGNERWPDRFYAMRAEKRGDDLVWLTPNSGTSFYDKWTAGYWRALP